MAEENGAPAEDAEEASEEVEETSEEDTTEEEPSTVAKTEFEKAVKRRDAALARARKAEAKLAELEEKEKGKEEDPVAKANARLVNASARTVLAAHGITDRADQREVLQVLDLSDISVNDDGPDEDEIEERIESLRRILAGTVKKRTPNTVRTRDRGNADTTDPDKSRYKRILGVG